ncbi:MAG: TolC family protein [Fidelibacterota bacterium]
MRRFIFIVTVFLLVAYSLTSASEHQVQNYIEIAVNNNSQLKSIKNQWQAEVERIDVSTKLPDPKFSFGVFVENVETAVGPQEYKIGLFQKLPWFGKLSTARKIQVHQAEIAWVKYQQAIDELTFQIQELLYKIALNREQLSITKETLVLTGQWSEILRAKYQNSTKSYADIIKVRQEIARQEEAITSLDREYRQLIVSLKSVLEVDILAPVKAEMERQLKEKDLNNMQELALANNPDLQIVRLKKQIAQLMNKRASQNLIPDAGIGVDYILTGDKYQSGGAKVNESGKDPLVFMLSLELPLQWRKIKKNINATEYQQQSAKDMETELQKGILANLENLIISLEDMSGKYKMYTGQIIPMTKESLAIRTAELKTGKTDIYKLIEDQRDLLEYQLKQAEILTNYSITNAKIAKLTGSAVQ